jgi:hypothetical protein
MKRKESNAPQIILFRHIARPKLKVRYKWIGLKRQFTRYPSHAAMAVCVS